ncbi:MAG TPA: alcohol dehydrogenase catalytic domain-containing protein [Spirochaetia bacterium]|nr:alcohol dehydrogenase catalytic domain-containing protein [Spirochaetia bacterium]
MKAAVLKSAYHVVVEDVPKPEVKPGHVLLNLKASAICGTDVGLYKGKVPVAMPRIIGHESAGQIVEVGQGVTSVKPGDRVVLNPLIFCRQCFYCFEGKTNLCENGGLRGRESDGTFAEFVVVPEYNVAKISDSISYDDATSLVALATVYQAQRKVNIVPGETVAVLGQGAAGLLHTQLARLAGARPVYAITRSQWKLDIAKTYGAETINGGETDPVAVVRENTGGRGADVVIESVGHEATIRQAMEMVRPGGRVLLFGITGPVINNFYGYAMYYKDLSLIGSRAMTPYDFELSIRAVESGALSLGSIVTHRFPLDDIVDALNLVDKRPGDALRVVINI